MPMIAHYSLVMQKWPPDVDPVALILWIKEPLKYVYQQEAHFRLVSRGK
jgi:hypothetical protein